EYRVYDSGLESLALNSLIAYRLEQNLIALRIDAKIFQPEHDSDPGPAAHTVDSEFFATQIFGSFDVWANHYVIRISAGKSRQHLDVMARRHCGQYRGSCGAADLDVPRSHSCDKGRATAQEYGLRFDAILCEETLVAGNPERHQARRRGGIADH